MKEYSEVEKKIARNEALKFAITSLTKNRHKSTVARKSYVRDIKDYLQTNGTQDDKETSSLLSESEIIQWESFYESIIRNKKARELRVAYLSGPNPENDIEILVENGILPENIWAFESDNTTYTKAVTSALESQFPFVKIYKGRIENYLKILPFKFDIIYLDFCGTVASEKTLSVVRDIFNYQKLETLGVLITNFAFPNKDNIENTDHRDNLNLLAANYLFPKSFTENYTHLGGGNRESAECHGIDPDEFFKIAKREEMTFYSQFITRILYDLPSVIIPYQRLANNEILKNLFFKNLYLFSWDEIPENDSGRLTDFLKQHYNINWVKTAKIEKIDDGKTIRLSSENNYLSLKLNNEKTEANMEIDDGRTDEFVVKMEKGKLNIYKSSFEEDYYEENVNALVWGLSNFFIKKESFEKLFNNFKRQLSIKSDEKTLLENIKLVSYFITERSQNNLHSDKLEKIRKNWKITGKYIFCDLFLFHQIKEILIGQLINPYYYNVDYTERWTYKAKETDMFMDLVTYDECRYVFDWMPTLDMFEEGIEDWNRQLSLRFAMDSISKQRMWYNDEFFSGTAVVDQGAKTFEAKELKKRKLVKR